MEIGLGVWADPIRAKEGATSTKKSLMNKMGILRHLPVFWDEITLPDVQKQAVDMSFGYTGGVEGSRLTSSIEQRERGTWCCILAMSSNDSLVDLVVKTQPSHRGGINRVLEYNVAPNEPGRLTMSTADADQIIRAMRSNFGHMGLQYAKFLAVNHKQISEEVIALRTKVSTDLGSTQEERFWTAGITAVLLGAKYADQLGCKLGLMELEKFLYSTFRANRDRAVSENMLGGSNENTEETLSAYLKSRATFQTLWVDGISGGVGRKSAITVLKHPPANLNVREGIMVVWDVPNRKLRISKRDFIAWMEHHKTPVSPAMRGLRNHFQMELHKVVLAAGTAYKALPESALCMAVPPNSPMEDIMLMYKDTTAPLEVVA
jgi:hypothetical protein